MYNFPEKYDQISPPYNLKPTIRLQNNQLREQEILREIARIVSISSPGPFISNLIHLSFIYRSSAVPSTASLIADYEKKQELARNIQKVKKQIMPIGVVSMIKDPAVKCDFETSLGPLPIEKTFNVTNSIPSKRRQFGRNDAEAPMLNIQKIKSSYYKYIKE